MNHRALFTILTLLSPMLLFGASGADGQGFLYGMFSVGVVTILFAIYALMRSGAAGNQLSTAGSTASQQSLSYSSTTTGNDAIVRATTPSDGEFSGSDFSAGVDIFDDEKDLLLDHEYDGIQELNNKLPPWWVGLFWITIIFAVIYFPYYHIFSGWTSASEYKAEMAAAKADVDTYLKESGGAVTEEDVTLMTGDADLAAGQETYATNCVSCHLADGGGVVGPNLTDKFWLHGGGIKDVFKTIKYGIPEKGMISWKSSLSPVQIQQVASYILVKLQGTTPANPKAPQGDEYIPE